MRVIIDDNLNSTPNVNFREKQNYLCCKKKKEASNHYSMLWMIKEESGLVSGLELGGLNHLLLAAFVLSFPLLHLNDFNFNLTSMNKV